MTSSRHAIKTVPVVPGIMIRYVQVKVCNISLPVTLGVKMSRLMVKERRLALLFSEIYILIS